MTRIVYWNIQQFSENKLDTIEYVVRGHLQRKRVRVDYTQRRTLIRRHFIATNADIVVVVEVSTGINAPATTMIYESGGWNGLETMLTYLRGVDAASNWNLVPPIVVGQMGLAEGVGVFYKSTILDGGGAVVGQRYFTGPNKFTGGAFGASFDPTLPGAVAAGPYPAAGLANGMAFFLPPARVLPAAALYNPLTPEDDCAARTEFISASAAVAVPPVNVNFGGRREPYETSFTEVIAAGPAVRHLTIFAVHSPPNYVQAHAHVEQMADCTPIASANQPAETKIIVGDFNMNLFTALGAQITGYDPLIAGVVPPGNVAMVGGNYTLMIRRDPLVNFAPGVIDGYYATHMKSLNDTRFYSTLLIPSYYPGFGYVGSSFVLGLYSIDNVLVRPAVGLLPAPVTSILNPVVGSPMNAPAWCRPQPPLLPSPPPPYGHVVFAASMATAAPFTMNPTNQAALGGAWNSYHEFDDFGHIRAASDHLALVTDV